MAGRSSRSTTGSTSADIAAADIAVRRPHEKCEVEDSTRWQQDTFHGLRKYAIATAHRTAAMRFTASVGFCDVDGRGPESCRRPAIG